MFTMNVIIQEIRDSTDHWHRALQAIPNSPHIVFLWSTYFKPFLILTSALLFYVEHDPCIHGMAAMDHVLHKGAAPKLRARKI